MEPVAEAAPGRPSCGCWGSCERRGWDSNPRTFRSLDFKSSAFNRSATPPKPAMCNRLRTTSPCQGFRPKRESGTCRCPTTTGYKKLAQIQGGRKRMNGLRKHRQGLSRSDVAWFRHIWDDEFASSCASLPARRSSRGVRHRCPSDVVSQVDGRGGRVRQSRTPSGRGRVPGVSTPRIASNRLDLLAERPPPLNRRLGCQTGPLAFVRSGR
jgi:hypothetical protein